MTQIYLYTAKEGVDVVYRSPTVRTPENYLTAVTFRHNEAIVAHLFLGPHLSPQPVIGTGYEKLVTGDTVTVEWQDRAGHSGTVRRIFDGRTD